MRRIKAIRHQPLNQYKRPRYAVAITVNGTCVNHHVIYFEPVDIMSALRELTVYIDNKTFMGDWDHDDLVGGYMFCNQHYCNEDIATDFTVQYHDEHGTKWDCEVEYE